MRFRRLASAASDGRVVLWDATSGQKMAEWATLGAAEALAFAADGRHLAVGHLNGTIYIFRAK